MWSPSRRAATGSIKRAAPEDDSRPVKTQVIVVRLTGDCSCRGVCGSTNGSPSSGGGLSNIDDDGNFKVYGNNNIEASASRSQAQSDGAIMDLDLCVNEFDGEEKEVNSAMLDEGPRAFYGRNAIWKSREQRKGMREVMRLRGKACLIIVLPTGGGKSIFLMLPSKVEVYGTTVVVVPFVALADNLVDRARGGFGLDCVRRLSSEDMNCCF